MKLIRTISSCKSCSSKFLSVAWLPYRVAGYCSEKCEGGRDHYREFQVAAIQKSIFAINAMHELDASVVARVESDE